MREKRRGEGEQEGTINNDTLQSIILSRMEKDYIQQRRGLDMLAYLPA